VKSKFTFRFQNIYIRNGINNAVCFHYQCRAYNKANGIARRILYPNLCDYELNYWVQLSKNDVGIVTSFKYEDGRRKRLTKIMKIRMSGV
jgi:hypothetical protein